MWGKYFKVIDCLIIENVVEIMVWFVIIVEIVVNIKMG